MNRNTIAITVLALLTTVILFAGNWYQDIVTITDSLILPVTQRYITVSASAAGVGNTAPTPTTIGTYRGLMFDADAELAFVNKEVPDDFSGAGDLAFRIYWCAQSGDLIQNTETVVFDIEWRSVNYDDAGETYDQGTVASDSSTYTATGEQTDKECFESIIALPYTGGNQPIAAGDVIGIKFNRDITTDTYTGEVTVIRFEISYPSVGVPNHF